MAMTQNLARALHTGACNTWKDTDNKNAVQYSSRSRLRCYPGCFHVISLQQDSKLFHGFGVWKCHSCLAMGKQKDSLVHSCEVQQKFNWEFPEKVSTRRKS